MAENQRETKDITRTFPDFLVSKKFSFCCSVLPQERSADLD